MSKKQEKQELTKVELLEEQLSNLEYDLSILEDEAQELDERGPDFGIVDGIRIQNKELPKRMKLYNIDCLALKQAGDVYVREHKIVEKKISDFLKVNTKKQGVLKKKIIKVENQIEKENEKEEMKKKDKVTF